MLDDEGDVDVVGLDDRWPDVGDPQEAPPEGYGLTQRRGERVSWTHPSDFIEVPVVLLYIRDPVASEPYWERWVRRVWAPPAAIVRECVVRPRALDVPLSFPIRVLLTVIKNRVDLGEKCHATMAIFTQFLNTQSPSLVARLRTMRR